MRVSRIVQNASRGLPSSGKDPVNCFLAMSRRTKLQVFDKYCTPDELALTPKDLPETYRIALAAGKS